MPVFKLLLLSLVTATVGAACGGGSTPTVTEGPDEVSISPAESGNGKAKGAEKPPKEEPATPEWTGPNFEVTTFQGERFELAAQAGHPVVLNFWESW
jgi:cytochrome oxidase Cu insertion factor (SCO1/SenC/PrrC family)